MGCLLTWWLLKVCFECVFILVDGRVRDIVYRETEAALRDRKRSMNKKYRGCIMVTVGRDGFLPGKNLFVGYLQFNHRGLATTGAEPAATSAAAPT